MEFLLNEDGDLEIHKVFDCSLKLPKPRVVAFAKHPTADGYADLILLQNSELKNRLKEKGVDRNDVDLRSNPSIRKALWDACDDLKLSSTEIELNNGDAKKIWEQIQRYLPIFALFRADRPSTDEDIEVQDPMKLAVRQAISELTNELQGIQDRIRNAALDVARRTLKKLHDVDPNLAKELTPTFRSDPKWDSLFKLSLMTDDRIPVNKRGSGVRRLILLGFFRAEAERRLTEENRSSIIYAFEEPEISQHPSNQRMLIEALKDLASTDGCQVLITTHVPGLAEMIPTDALRYVRLVGNDTRVVEEGSEDVFKRIAGELGVIPDNRVRVFVYVEGPNDVVFLKNMARILMMEGYEAGFDPDNTPEIVFLPLGGSTLRDWVNSYYLKPLGRPEIHIYDRDENDPPKYQKVCNRVNSRKDGSQGFITSKRELENYLHPEAIKKSLNISIHVDDNSDIPELVARARHEARHPDRPWDGLRSSIRKKCISYAKRLLNENVVKVMTTEMLHQRGGKEEILRWFTAIKKHLN